MTQKINKENPNEYYLIITYDNNIVKTKIKQESREQSRWRKRWAEKAKNKIRKYKEI